MSLIKIFRIITSIFSVAGIIIGITIISGSEGQIDNMLYLTYIVFITILVFVVGFTLKNTFSNKHTLKSTLTGLGSFLLVAVIAYFMADGTATLNIDDVEVLSGSGTKLVNTGLYLFYALAVIAIGSIVLSGVKSSFKK